MISEEKTLDSIDAKLSEMRTAFDNLLAGDCSISMDAPELPGGELEIGGCPIDVYWNLRYLARALEDHLVDLISREGIVK